MTGHPGAAVIQGQQLLLGVEGLVMDRHRGDQAIGQSGEGNAR